MAKLYIIGVGLYPDLTTIRAVEILKHVRYIFYEKYTSDLKQDILMQTLSRYVDLSSKQIIELTRQDIEDRNCEKILKVLNSGEDAVLLVPGDPMIATTHSTVRIIVKKAGHDVELIFGISILCAAISILGLSPYKFGPVATVTYPRLGVYSERPYDVVKENLERGLHTLLLLDVKDEGGFMTIREAVEILFKLEEIRREGVFTPDRVAIGLARVGYPDFKVHVDILERLAEYDFGEPPHSIVIPARLNPVEAELLKIEFNVPEDILRKLT